MTNHHAKLFRIAAIWAVACAPVAAEGPYHLVQEVEAGDSWNHVEDYAIPFGRDMSMQCPPDRLCEIATGMAYGGDVGRNNRGAFSGNKEFNIGPAGAIYARMADGKGTGKMRYFAGKIGTKTWEF